jgi:hypothetical protein
VIRPGPLEERNRKEPDLALDFGINHQIIILAREGDHVPTDVAIGLVVDGILDPLGRMAAGLADASSRQ